MAIIGGAFSTAFQSRPAAFQFGAFQVNTARINAAGDTAYPAEIAYLERLRKIRQWQEERRRRYDLRKRRELDRQIDAYLNNRDGAEGERDESERWASERAVLAKAKSAVAPLKPFRPQPAGPPSQLGDQLRATASIVLPRAQERPETAYLHSRLAAYGADQAATRAQAMAQFTKLAGAPAEARQSALDQLLGVPIKRTVMPPDQLLAALAKGQREMQRLRGY